MELLPHTTIHGSPQSLSQGLPRGGQSRQGTQNDKARPTTPAKGPRAPPGGISQTPQHRMDPISDLSPQTGRIYLPGSI